MILYLDVMIYRVNILHRLIFKSLNQIFKILKFCISALILLGLSSCYEIPPELQAQLFASGNGGVPVILGFRVAVPAIKSVTSIDEHKISLTWDKIDLTKYKDDDGKVFDKDDVDLEIYYLESDKGSVAPKTTDEIYNNSETKIYTVNDVASITSLTFSNLNKNKNYYFALKTKITSLKVADKVDGVANVWKSTSTKTKIPAPPILNKTAKSNNITLTWEPIQLTGLKKNDGTDIVESDIEIEIYYLEKTVGSDITAIPGNTLPPLDLIYASPTKDIVSGDKTDVVLTVNSDMDYYYALKTKIITDKLALSEKLDGTAAHWDKITTPIQIADIAPPPIPVLIEGDFLFIKDMFNDAFLYDDIKAPIFLYSNRNMFWKRTYELTYKEFTVAKTIQADNSYDPNDVLIQSKASTGNTKTVTIEAERFYFNSGYTIVLPITIEKLGITGFTTKTDIDNFYTGLSNPTEVDYLFDIVSLKLVGGTQTPIQNPPDPFKNEDITISRNAILTPQGLRVLEKDLADSYTIEKNIRLHMTGDWDPIGSNTAPFTGSLDGQYYSLIISADTNGRNWPGLIHNIAGANPSITTSVKDFTIDIQSTLSAKDSSASGILAKTLTQGSISYLRIKSDNNIFYDTEGIDTRGGVVGSIAASDNVLMDDINVDLDISTGNTTGTLSYYGGIIGKIESGTAPTPDIVLTQLDFDGNIYSSKSANSNQYFSYIGGIVGSVSPAANSNTRIFASVARSESVEIRGTQYVGAAAGIVENASFTLNDMGTTIVEGTKSISSNVGGVVGYSENSTISINNMGTTGVISVYGHQNVGGIVGQLSFAATLTTNNVGNLNIKGTDDTKTSFEEGSNIGGAVGLMLNNANINTTTIGGAGAISVKGTHYVGGLVGRLQNASIGDSTRTDITVLLENTTVEGTKSIDSFVGGAVGFAENNAKIYTTQIGDRIKVSVRGPQHIGGLVGRMTNLSSVKDSVVNHATIESTKAASSTDSYVGGVTGLGDEDISITDIKVGVTGPVIVKGPQAIGGVVGYLTNPTTLSDIEVGNTTVEGTRSTETYVGGAIGILDNYSISNIIVGNLGAVNVKGPQAIGGLVGYLTNNSTINDDVSIINTSVISDRALLSYAGGLAGITERSTIQKQIIGPTNITEIISVRGSQYVGGVTGLLKESTLLTDDAGYLDVYGKPANADVGVMGVAADAYVGGMVGYSDSSTINPFTANTPITIGKYGTIYVNRGDRIGGDYTGGIIGYSVDTVIAKIKIESVGDANQIYGRLCTGGAIGKIVYENIAPAPLSFEAVGTLKVGGDTITIGNKAFFVGCAKNIIIASAKINGNIEGGKATIKIYGPTNIAGVVGHMEQSTVTIDEISNVEIEGKHYFWGSKYEGTNSASAIGYAEDSTITIKKLNPRNNEILYVIGHRNVGGAVGTLRNSTLDIDEIGSATIFVDESTTSNAGGLVGVADNSTVTISKASNIKIDAFQNIGGAVGILEDSTLTIDWLDSATLIATQENLSNTGGLVGLSKNSTIDASKVGNVGLTTIRGSENLGGIVGYATDTTITSSTVSNIVIIGTSGSDTKVGGAVGYSSNSNINVKIGELGSVLVQGFSQIGGAIGSAIDSTINAQVDDKVGATDKIIKIVGRVRVGGMVGNSEGSTIKGYVRFKNSDYDTLVKSKKLPVPYATPIRDRIDANDVGGIVYGNNTDSNVDRYIGGIVGYASNSKIYAWGEVLINAARVAVIGGMVGSALNSTEVVGYVSGTIIATRQARYLSAFISWPLTNNIKAIGYVKNMKVVHTTAPVNTANALSLFSGKDFFSAANVFILNPSKLIGNGVENTSQLLLAGRGNLKATSKVKYYSTAPTYSLVPNTSTPPVNELVLNSGTNPNKYENFTFGTDVGEWVFKDANNPPILAGGTDIFGTQ